MGVNLIVAYFDANRNEDGKNRNTKTTRKRRKYHRKQQQRRTFFLYSGLMS